MCVRVLCKLTFDNNNQNKAKAVKLDASVQSWDGGSQFGTLVARRRVSPLAPVEVLAMASRATVQILIPSARCGEDCLFAMEHVSVHFHLSTVKNGEMFSVAGDCSLRRAWSLAIIHGSVYSRWTL